MPSNEQNPPEESFSPDFKRQIAAASAGLMKTHAILEEIKKLARPGDENIESRISRTMEFMIAMEKVDMIFTQFQN